MSDTLWEGITINIKATNIDLTQELRDYIEKRITKLGTLLVKQEEDVFVYFEIAKTTEHHQQGDIFRADCSVDIGGKRFHARSDTEDIRASIDDVKSKLFREIRNSKRKDDSLMRRGSARLKKLLKFGK